MEDFQRVTIENIADHIRQRKGISYLMIRISRVLAEELPNPPDFIKLLAGSPATSDETIHPDLQELAEDLI